MSTRSTISIKEGNKFRTVYCHSDGYPSYNGKILKENYTDEKKIKSLIDLGDLSSLDKEVAPIGDTGTVRKWVSGQGMVSEPTNESHSFDNRWDGVTTAYARDRGETGTEAREYDSKDDIQGEEYDYVFENGVWMIRDNHKGNGFVVLSDIIIGND